jgi:hypothetical protein
MTSSRTQTQSQTPESGRSKPALSAASDCFIRKTGREFPELSSA